MSNLLDLICDLKISHRCRKGIGGSCYCGADDHNAKVDKLAELIKTCKLDILILGDSLGKSQRENQDEGDDADVLTTYLREELAHRIADESVARLNGAQDREEPPDFRNIVYYAVIKVLSGC